MCNLELLIIGLQMTLKVFRRSCKVFLCTFFVGSLGLGFTKKRFFGKKDM
jgi:hypothetical protein